MTIEDTTIVDVISVDPSGRAVLTISDHLDWQDVEAHLRLLQDKMSTYLAFIESGELDESHPAGKGRPLLIDIVGKFPVHSDGYAFLQRVEPILSSMGIELRSRLLEE